MNTPLLNINDLALLLVIAQCGMLAIILVLLREKAGSGNGLLALLLVTFALAALDILVYWALPIKELLAPWGVWPFWIFGWAPLLQGPLLYAYVRTKLVGQAVAWRKDAWHLVPAVIYIPFVLGVFWQLGEQGVQAGVYDFGTLFNSRLYQWLNWSQTVLPLAYGVWTLSYLHRSALRLEATFSNPALAQPRWLTMVVLGFVGLSFWNFVNDVMGWLQVGQVAHWMGLLANYFSFAYVTALVFYSLLKSQLIITAPAQPPEKSPAGPSDNDHAKAEELKQLLIQQELFLNPELTVEQFAQAANMPERQLSQLINTCLGNNFFELVNLARVERAKVLLQSKAWSVQRVLEESGFNSKATFNRIFKRYAEQTPSEYRKTARAQQS